ncbi:signal peptidase I [Candidatus Saccharibacteria bacterium]|nr:signal peptidase I [Candidatus Saccharibacteria bacterium]MBR6122995.1 signal peptidase I [Candidatus Saccharibacteria bacterium]
MSQTKIPVVVYSEIFYPKFSVSRTRVIPVNFVEDPTETPAPILTTTVTKFADTSAPKRSRFKLLRSKLGTLATAAVAILAVALVGAKILGFRTFTVMSGSMEPDYPVGSMIYVQPADYKSLQVGDVISYVANNDKTVVTHRIVGIEVDEKDPTVLRFRTQGDANSSPDAALVHYKNVLGTPILTIPYLGYIAHNIQQPPGIYITLVAGTLLLAWTFLPGTLEERRKTARKSVA